MNKLKVLKIYLSLDFYHTSLKSSYLFFSCIANIINTLKQNE